jgi:hypothetical protein
MYKEEFFGALIGWAIILAGSALALTLLYGVIVIIFRSAFGVELWNPFR